MTEPLVYTVEEAASLLRIGRGAAYAAVAAGEIPGVHIGRSIRVSKAALDAMLGIAQNDEPTHDDEPMLELLKNDDAPGANRREVRICSTTAGARDDVLRAA